MLNKCKEPVLFGGGTSISSDPLMRKINVVYTNTPTFLTQSSTLLG
jgi:hypothetical protein